jgi:hypothetical protein
MVARASGRRHRPRIRLKKVTMPCVFYRILNDNHDSASIMKHEIFLPWSRHAHCWLGCTSARPLSRLPPSVIMCPTSRPLHQTKICPAEIKRLVHLPKPGGLTALSPPGRDRCPPECRSQPSDLAGQWPEAREAIPCWALLRPWQSQTHNTAQQQIKAKHVTVSARVQQTRIS